MNTGLNKLELALLDPNDIYLELYIEDSSNAQIKADIEEIKFKAACSTDAGKILKDLQDLIAKHGS